MANGIHFDAEPLLKKLKVLEKHSPDIGREAVRAGCRAAGLHMRNAVKRKVPVLKPHNVWNEWPRRYSSGRRRSRTSTGQSLPIVQGELLRSIYFTYSPSNSSIPNGYMTYLVGFPHSHGGGNIVKGWYGHFINNGHALYNYAVHIGPKKASRLGIDEGTYPGKMYTRIAWVEGYNFIGRGYSESHTAAEQLMNQAAEAKIKEMFKQRGI